MEKPLLSTSLRLQQVCCILPIDREFGFMRGKLFDCHRTLDMRVVRAACLRTDQPKNGVYRSMNHKNYPVRYLLKAQSLFLFRQFSFDAKRAAQPEVAWSQCRHTNQRLFVARKPQSRDERPSKVAHEQGAIFERSVPRYDMPNPPVQ